jgi:phosphatidylglycerol:prolipoprotein diacylglycerol transferase
MYPELFKIPFTPLTVKSYGLMLVVGFLAAVFLIKRLSRNIASNPQIVTNAALYALIAGVVGSRIFYVMHHFEQFEGRLLSVFAIWQGGLEFLGGVFLAIVILVFYMRHHKLPVRRYFDIIAICLMLAAGFGRTGCFLNGCCFGKPVNLPWAVRFPYGSYCYYSQVSPDPARKRFQPYMELPADFFNYFERNGVRYSELKPYIELTDEQRKLAAGKYRCLPVHPTQLYESAALFGNSILLYLFWRRSQRAGGRKGSVGLFTKAGSTFALAFMLYGISRFSIEFLRGDNPFEFDSLTISQNISALLVVFGAVLMVILEKIKPDKTGENI